MRKVIIAGGRDFGVPGEPGSLGDYDFLESRLSALLHECDYPNLEIVSGGARGADALGERWAEHHHVKVRRFPADWDKHGKSAGPIRNREMAEYADELVAFWDGRSRGTKNMIDTMFLMRKPVHVFFYE